MMLTAKEKIIAFLLALAVVTLMNGILKYSMIKDYTLPYPETLADAQKNIDNEIVTIKDRAVTRGSVLLLADMKDGTTKLYHLQRGYLTPKYQYVVFERVEDREILIRDNFEEFRLNVVESAIAINPMSFKRNIEFATLISLWLLPMIVITKAIIHFIKNKKEKLVYTEKAVG